MKILIWQHPATYNIFGSAEFSKLWLLFSGTVSSIKLFRRTNPQKLVEFSTKEHVIVTSINLSTSLGDGERYPVLMECPQGQLYNTHRQVQVLDMGKNQ